ncbi:MAG: acyl-CoA carboxylase subunit beta [Puniceicoccaceae bacterium]|nr:MAG: acyl-CoA carboxylase subunit beta [Puniceicoccaceae bacterium]
MAIDPRLLEELKKRRATAQNAGGAEKLAARKKKGQLGARERLETFFESGTFQEFGMHAEHSCHRFGMEKKSLPYDGVVCGTGLVDGRAVAAYAQDFTVSGGSLGRIHAKKICDLMDFAHEAGMPVVGVNDSGGARIQEGVDSLSGYGQVFFKNVLLSGVVPQIAVIAGPCAGGAAYSPALTDFLIMTKEHSNMFICGPDVIKSATGETAQLEQFASAAAHASISGNIHLVADDDAHAMELTTKLLAFLPSNNISDPPHEFPDLDLRDDPQMNELVPASGKEALDVMAVIDRLVDDGDFFEIMPDFARNIVVGFARIEGIVVGIVANNPMVRAGTLDIDSSDKGARFIRTCNIYNIPIVTLVDVPGFMPGLAQEQGGIIRHGAKMLFAYAASTVPKITLIMRKAYGGAYLAMCSADLGADMVFAWPTAEIAVMGAEGAVKILFRKEIKEAADPRAKIAELCENYRNEFSSPYQAAANSMITDVIEPAQTRSSIALALRNTLNKRDSRPPKKHGNIPL